MVLGLLMGLGGAAMSILGMGMQVAPSYGGAVDNVLIAYYTRAQRRKFRDLPSQVLDAPTLTTSRLTGLINDEQYFNWMRELGYTHKKASVTLRASRQLLTMEQLAIAWYKRHITINDYYRLAQRSGIPRAEAEVFLLSQRTPISPTDTLNAFWRGVIDREEYNERMKDSGYRPKDAKVFEQANLFFPPQSDLIRFQVREIFKPDVVEKYGLAEEFPHAILEHSQKLGISDEIMQWYWKAHWFLPSPTQVYTMLHRLHPEVLKVTAPSYDFSPEFMKECETTPETVADFLRIADYSTFWRKRLMAISYRPLTRVDLRRIYMLGIVSDAEVVANLRQTGYTKRDAEKLLRHFKTKKVPRARRLTLAQLRTMYGYGIIQENEFDAELSEMGFEIGDIKLIKKLLKRGIREREIKEKLRTYQREYVEGRISLEEIRTRLGRVGFREEKINEFLRKIMRAERRRIRHPPLGDLKRWYRHRVINEAKFRAFLKNKGFPTKYIDIYVQVYRPKKITK